MSYTHNIWGELAIEVQRRLPQETAESVSSPLHEQLQAIDKKAWIRAMNSILIVGGAGVYITHYYSFKDAFKESN